MTQKNTQDDFIKTALRLPRGLHAAILSSAEESGRSMNAEIIHRLYQALSRDTRQDLTDPDKETNDTLQPQSEMKSVLSRLEQLELSYLALIKNIIIERDNDPIIKRDATHKNEIEKLRQNAKKARE